MCSSSGSIGVPNLATHVARLVQHVDISSIAARAVSARQARERRRKGKVEDIEAHTAMAKWGRRLCGISCDLATWTSKGMRAREAQSPSSRTAPAYDQLQQAEEITLRGRRSLVHVVVVSRRI